MIGDEIASLSERDEPDAWSDWERELIEVAREVEKASKQYVRLPTTWDVHEWDIMRDFCDTVGDDRVASDSLSRSLSSLTLRKFRD